jgi:hypothetical protein
MIARFLRHLCGYFRPWTEDSRGSCDDYYHDDEKEYEEEDKEDEDEK